MILRGFLAVNPNRGPTYCSASLSSIRSRVVRTASSPAVEYCFSFPFAEATDSTIHILRPGDRPDRYAAIRGRRVELSRIRKTVSDAHQRTREVTVDHKTATRGHQPSSWNLPEMLTAKELEALLKIDVKTIYAYVQRGLIPYVRIQSNLRFPKQQILGWIEERNFRPRVMNGNRNTAQ